LTLLHNALAGALNLSAHTVMTTSSQKRKQQKQQR